MPAVVAVDRYNEANYAVQQAGGAGPRWSVQAILAEANAMGGRTSTRCGPKAARRCVSGEQAPVDRSLASAVESGGIALPITQLLAELEAFTYG